jgi:hypothetical protein
MNATGGMFKEKNWGNYQNRFLFVIRGCECFWSSRVHNSMSVESSIKKLQKITKEKEGQRSEHKQR